MSCGATFSVLNGGEKEQTKDKETEIQQMTKQLERRISVLINFLKMSLRCVATFVLTFKNLKQVTAFVMSFLFIPLIGL